MKPAGAPATAVGGPLFVIERSAEVATVVVVAGDETLFALLESMVPFDETDLAETLGNLSNIIRRRKEVRLKARALSAEAKASAFVLALLPAGPAVVFL